MQSIRIDGTTYTGATTLTITNIGTGVMQIAIIKTTSVENLWGKYVDGNSVLIRKKNKTTGLWLDWRSI